jgi:hypothetical protein
LLPKIAIKAAKINRKKAKNDEITMKNAFYLFDNK